MQKQLILTGLLAMLAGCSQDPAPAPQENAAAVSPSPNGSAPDETVAGTSDSPFPVGNPLTGPFHVRSNRVYSTKGGMQRRRSTIELSSGDTASIAQDISRQMTSAGLRQLKAVDQAGDVTRLGFLGKDVGRVYVTLSSDVGKHPVNPNAVGVVTFDWRVAKSSAKPAIQSDP